MKKNLWLLCIAIFLLLTTDGYGQRRKLRSYDTDLYISAVSFHREIGLNGGSLVNNFSGFRPDVGFRTGFRITPDFVATMYLGYIMYGGKLQENTGYMGNYTFNSAAFQHTLRMEYFIIGDGRRINPGAVFNRRGMINSYRRFYLYAFAGAGGVLSKSKIKDLNNGGEEPLANPGYDNSFQYGYVFPMGGGTRYAISRDWSIGAEIGYQFSTSDLLDGYCPEDYPDSNDSYFMTCVKAVYKIRNHRRGLPLFASRNY